MEPMNLGSAPSSPPSPNPNFLPAFLMGDTQPSPNPSQSPGRNRTPGAMKLQQPGYTSATPTNLRHKVFNNSMGDFNVPGAFNSPAIEKGPPRQGLFDTIDAKAKTPVLSSTLANVHEQAAFSPDQSFSRIGSDSVCYGMNESRQMFQYRNDRVDTLWVTVFGFQPSTSSLVLTQLASCGTIVEKKYPTQGNWMNIKYSTPHEVAKALLLNGKLISNCTMIGVVPYHCKESNKENLETSFASPIRARSLRPTMTPNQTASTSVLPPQNVPQKNSDLMTRAIEYIFGW